MLLTIFIGILAIIIIAGGLVGISLAMNSVESNLEALIEAVQNRYKEWRPKAFLEAKQAEQEAMKQGSKKPRLGG